MVVSASLGQRTGILEPEPKSAVGTSSASSFRLLASFDFERTFSSFEGAAEHSQVRVISMPTAGVFQVAISRLTARASFTGLALLVRRTKLAGPFALNSGGKV